MDRLAKTQEEKIVETMARFPFEEKIKTMDRVAITQDQKSVETMARFSI